DDVVDQMWTDNVLPLMDSLGTLAGFGLTFNQVRTDTNGFVVTGTIDASAGVTVAGSGPYPVSSAVASGVTSNINTLLAQQSLGGVPSDIIVSLHPNVTNQYLTAVHDHVNGSYGTTPTSSAIATALVDPALGACYTPGGWTTRLEAQAPAHLSSTAGAPEMQLPQATVQFRNAGCNPFNPQVATYTGSLDDIAVTSTGTPLGPNGSASTAAWTATLTQAAPAAAALVPPATTATLLPWARDALATFVGSVPGHVDLMPGGFPGQTVTHCSCAGYSGDQRITETFHIT
ncbi:MAG TPA: hypothetical protein VK507_12075, partial [Iamia sp.]|nr:hypothetical protein [Iamia sp.]